ncbi:Uncharacterised protein [Mycobacteroides abscessus subsp. abscessus]|nr:Uncharacterised protein [Mycobacteroides abscessus subsp. abscessus]
MLSPPAMTPSPKQRIRNCAAPPRLGNRAPSLAYEYTLNSETRPPTRNATGIHTPAVVAASPTSV